jgi:energy-coupling factor transport system substrate-specific component
MVESRDQNTGDHVKNTAEYTRIIMDEMVKEGIYKDLLTPELISDIYHSAPLHDVGKISISDTILNKPGKLTDEEFEKMKSHSEEGAMIIDRVMNSMPQSDAGYLKEARNLALYHHEKWDGTGYPTGLSGEEIPLSARIMAVADVFDALISERSYKKAFSFEKAIEIIKESSGTHFDPNIVKAFLNAKDEVRKIANK